MSRPRPGGWPARHRQARAMLRLGRRRLPGAAARVAAAFRDPDRIAALRRRLDAHGRHLQTAGATGAAVARRLSAVAAREARPARLAVRRRRAGRWWAAAAGNLQGSVLMIAAFVAFSAMLAGIKAIGDGLPLSQVLVIRQCIMMVVLAPLFLHDLGGALRTNHLRLQMVRGACSLGSMLFGFTALKHVPLADFTAISFSQVLFVTVAAVLVLRETVGLRRWMATAIGFVGVLVMLRPGQGGLDPHALLAVVAAMFGAGIVISVRVMAQSERTATIMLYQALFLLAVLLPPTLWLWQTPTAEQWWLLAVIGLSGTAGQFLITRAYQVGEAAALAPLDFVRLILATAIGILVFGEWPDLTTLAGALLVVGATVYTIRRNTARRSDETAPTARHQEVP